MSSKAKISQQIPSDYEIVFEGPIQIDQIKIQSNCRKEFEENALKELASNIQKVGVIQPIVVRPDGDDFILVAGERRLRAAKSIGMTKISARVMMLNEQQAEEIQALENLHRKDLNPIEEAQAFHSLLNTAHDIPIDDLAAKLNKSSKYVYRALRLLELPKNMTTAIISGTLTAAHGHQVLRAPKEKWDALIKFATTKGWRNDFPTVQELKLQVEKSVQRDLDGAYFPKDKPYADAPACTNCPYNTGNQNMLIDGAIKGHCTNPGCFNKKTNQALKDLRDQAKEKFPKLEYVGAASDSGYSSGKTIKKFPVVDPSNKKIKGLLKDAPDKFGFGILKPNFYSQTKKPQVVLVCLDPKLLPKDKTSESQNKDWEKERFVNQKVRLGLFRFAWEKLESIQRRDLDDTLWVLLNQHSYSNSLTSEVLQLVLPNKEEVRIDDFKEIPDPTILRMIYFCVLASEDELEEWFVYRKIDHQSTLETLKKAGEKEYDTLKASQKGAVEGSQS